MLRLIKLRKRKRSRVSSDKENLVKNIESLTDREKFYTYLFVCLYPIRYFHLNLKYEVSHDIYGQSGYYYHRDLTTSVSIWFNTFKFFVQCCSLLYKLRMYDTEQFSNIPVMTKWNWSSRRLKTPRITRKATKQSWILRTKGYLLNLLLVLGEWEVSPTLVSYNLSQLIKQFTAFFRLK